MTELQRLRRRNEWLEACLAEALEELRTTFDYEAILFPTWEKESKALRLGGKIRPFPPSSQN